MYAQNEFKSAYGEKSTEAQVNQIYKNLFDREADVTGLTYWTQQINLGVLKVAEIATHLIWAAQNNDGSADDKTALTNRTDAAVAYTAEVKKTTAGILAYQPQSTDPWVSGSNISEAITYLSGIDKDTASTEAGITASVNAIVATGDVTKSGSTFVLTSGTDTAGKTSAANGALSSTFRFTDGGNETVEADIGTIGAADVLLDGSSTDSDTLNVTINAASGAFTTNRIETINVDMAAGSPELNTTNISNTNTINVTGSVNGKIDALSTSSSTLNITTDGYQRVLNIDTTAMSGTTALGTADVINVSVSGSDYGSTAATQTEIEIESAGASVLETLNITSAGTAANDFLLDASTNATFSTVNFLGATDLTVRADRADITGVTMVAGDHTGTSDLIVDNNGGAVLNMLNFTGFDTVSIKDGTSPAKGGDALSATGVRSGQTIAFLDDGAAGVITGTAVSGSSDSLTFVLDNETDATDTDLTSLDVQNVETLTIKSQGNVSTSTTAQNEIDLLTGDATSITISGDTSFDLDASIDAPSTGTRSVTIDASTNTSFVDISAVNNTKVYYTITGTAGADTLASNSSASTINGGEGNDTITSGDGNDTVDAGDGLDTINVSYGTDKITGGTGNDTIDIDATSAAATVQVTSGLNLNSTVTLATNDKIQLTLNGDTYESTFATNAATTIINFVSAHKTTILAEHGVTIAAADTNTDVSLTGKTDGTTFTADFNIWDNSNTAVVAQTETTSTAGVAAKDVSTTIVDFKSDTLNTDIINTEGLSALGTGGYYEGADGDMIAATAYGVIVITDAAFASSDTADDDIAITSTSATDAVVVFLNSTTGYAEAYFDANIANATTIAAVDTIFTFENITSLTQLASTFSSSNFTI